MGDQGWEDRGAFIIPLLVFVLLVLIAFWPSLGSVVKSLEWGSLLKNAETIAKIGAIVLGGIWTYYGFIKGRVYMPRLEPKVTGRIENIQGTTYLIAKLELKNLGASKVSILNTSGLDVFKDITNAGGGVHPIEFDSNVWDPNPTLFRAFEDHQWIEPSETIQEEKLIAFTVGTNSLLKLRLQVETERTTTSAMTIVKLKSDGHSRPTFE